MTRVFHRPMFRKGGSVNEGITSGMAPRQGYANPAGIVEQIRPTQQEYESISGMLPPRGRDTSLNDFLINFGLDLATRSPQGGIFQTAAESAKAPFGLLQQQKAARTGVDRAEAVDILKTIMDAKASAVGSEGGSGLFSKQASAGEVEKLMSDLFKLQADQQKEETAMDEDLFEQEKKKIISQLQVYVDNPAVKSLFSSAKQAEMVIDGIQNAIINSKEEIKVINDQGEEEVVIEGVYAQGNPKYLADKTAEMYLKQYQEALEGSLGLKEGGRASYQVGGEVMEEEVTETIPPQQSNDLSFEELRARLPREISDDIIHILVECPDALIEFAEIQTQDDVDQFNMKYGVNLVLPSGA